MTFADAPNSSHTSPKPDEAPKKKSPDAVILLAVALLLLVWGLAIFLFGIPGLYIPALASVPLIWIVLIAISRG
ncbi:hypothetical protein TG4357_02461 [Thalassovita gelatinovora]|uniref:Uncharacterized protein n=1 Tax=Thalassovita gelatinovora TaxID=53501 RepID=A0A0N7LVJ9_THAGE|nr:hypothetical protein [Thalassovita gelatinovora]QIZ79960.1 hypothetical protein HFZ77_05415 [Thalassovita gelatinovora]CUH66506.1 hypothetical protein TG4357_02461 [Thalassovita gelatinovora]SER13047.1 hypothetical protein SAMN04488043_1172 [Thalassovita gelatinovora]